MRRWCASPVRWKRHPDVGLIQTLPIITGATTLFARVQQFAGRVYGPLIAHGIAWWHGAEGNYWGHNAMIRTRAFAEQAGLPELARPQAVRRADHEPRLRRGRAAAARRLGGAHGARRARQLRGGAADADRSRGARPALVPGQSAACRGAADARPLSISRLHLLTGIGSYITAPLWLLFILSGILIAVQARFVLPDYFPQGKSLFPQWPVVDPVRAMWMFVGTMGLLLVPKLLGCVAILLRRQERRGFGARCVCWPVSCSRRWSPGLIAPVVMLTQTIDVVAILLGRDSGWNAQRRGDGAIPARETRRLYRRHTVLGLLLGGVAWAVSLSLALWMLPVVLGLALAIPLALVTGRRWAAWCAAHARGHCAACRGCARVGVAARMAGRWPNLVSHSLLRDPTLLEAHKAMLPPPRRPRLDPIDVTLLSARTKIDEAETLDGCSGGTGDGRSWLRRWAMPSRLNASQRWRRPRMVAANLAKEKYRSGDSAGPVIVGAAFGHGGD